MAKPSTSHGSAPRIELRVPARRFDLVPWLAGLLLYLMLAAIMIREVGGPRIGWYRELGLFVSWAYAGAAVAFGSVVARRWHNTYFRWRTLSTALCQLLFGVILLGPLTGVLDIPLWARRLHLTWPLHMGVLDPAWLSSPYILVYGAVVSLVFWPALTYFFGMRYCSWFCACGNLAENAGDPFRTRGPKGERAQGLDPVMYLLLGTASAATLIIWLGVGDARNWYHWVVGVGLADLAGVGLYPVFGSRVWCRWFCPLAAMLGWVSKRGRFAIYTDDQRCIECGTCNRYCEMGIDIRMRARKGIPMKDDECVACGACIAVCPRYALSFRPYPDEKASRETKTSFRWRRPYVRQMAAPRK